MAERGETHDVGEMSRICLALMAELDAPSPFIIVGTTNRYERLDKALVRRFTLRCEITPLNADEAVEVARRLFQAAKIDADGWLGAWLTENIKGNMPAAEVVQLCTDRIVSEIIKEE